MQTSLLMVIAAILLVLLAILLGRIWASYSQTSPEEDDYQRSMATLNDHQANRLSDSQIRNPVNTDSGWDEMVRRGQNDRRPQRKRPRR